MVGSSNLLGSCYLVGTLEGILLWRILVLPPMLQGVACMQPMVPHDIPGCGWVAASVDGIMLEPPQELLPVQGCWVEGGREGGREGSREGSHAWCAALQQSNNENIHKFV